MRLFFEIEKILNTKFVFQKQQFFLINHFIWSSQLHSINTEGHIFFKLKATILNTKYIFQKQINHFIWS